MTGRRLYERYTDTLAEHTRREYREGEYVRVFPVRAPLAWGFLARDDRDIWNTLAKKITPRKRKV